MNKRFIRNRIADVIAGGATAAAGLLTLAGIFLVTSSLYVCIPVFILAIAYEAQVNKETIGIALRRIFDPSYLKRKLIQQFIANKLEEFERSGDQDNAYFRDYKNKQSDLLTLQAIKLPTPEQLALIKKIKRDIKNMEMYLLLQLEQGDALSGSKQSAAIHAFIGNDRKALLAEIKRKQWVIRISWLFALSGGASVGLATINAGVAAIGTLSFLSFVPGAGLVALGALAAIGYTLLCYQTIADIVQTYGNTIRKQFASRDDESQWMYGLRLAGIALGIGLAIVATFATAGTWWIAAKKGAEIIKTGSQAASILRTIAVSLTILPTFIFSTKNAVESINKMSRSDYRELASQGMAEIKNAWNNESHFQFFNPFRFVEKCYTNTVKSLLFIGHLVSGGFMTDRMPLIPIPPVATAALIAGGEGLTHANYLPSEQEEHEHASLPLKMIFGIVAIPAVILKGLAVLWDAVATGSLSTSYEHIFSTEKVVESATPQLIEQVAPPLDWNTRHIMKIITNDTVNRVSSPSMIDSEELSPVVIEQENNLQDEDNSLNRLINRPRIM